MRIADARYLEHVRTEESVTILKNLLLNDPNEEVRKVAKDSLLEIDRQNK